MATYTKTCDQGHEPMTMTVTADNDDDAMTQMMAQVKQHMAENHQGMQQSDEEIMENIKSSWTKAE